VAPRRSSASRARAAAPGRRKVFFYEEHPLMILGVGALIDEQADLRFNGSCGEPDRLSGELTEAKADVLVLDIALYTRPSFDLIRRVRKDHPDLPIVILSVHSNTEYVQKARKAGADAYVMKAEDPSLLLEAIRAALGREEYISPGVTVPRKKQREGPNDSPINRLTRREFEILQHVGKGFTNRQIADELDLPVKTVEDDCRDIESKLDLEDATELLQFAIHWVHHEGGFE
jgi:DNA-binding NarL/FixJ family response regulator